MIFSSRPSVSVSGRQRPPWYVDYQTRNVLSREFCDTGENCYHPPVLLSKREAAAALGLGRTTLQLALRRRQIGFVRIGRRILLRAEDIDRFIKSKRVPPRKPRGKKTQPLT